MEPEARRRPVPPKPGDLPSKIRIVGDGTRNGTIVTDAATGAELPFVSRIEIVIDANADLPRVTLSSCVQNEDAREGDDAYTDDQRPIGAVDLDLTLASGCAADAVAAEKQAIKRLDDAFDHISVKHQSLQGFHERLAGLHADTVCVVCRADDWDERVIAEPVAAQSAHWNVQLGAIRRICRRCGAYQTFTALAPTETA